MAIPLMWYTVRYDIFLIKKWPNHPTFNNVSDRSRSNVKKMLNFTLRQIFVAWKKVSELPF